MNNRVSDTITLTGVMKRIELPPTTIYALTFYAPLLKRESTQVVEHIERLADVFGLSYNSASYTGDVMNLGRLRSRWIIIVKGDEISVASFEREAGKLE